MGASLQIVSVLTIVFKQMVPVAIVRKDELSQYCNEVLVQVRILRLYALELLFQHLDSMSLFKLSMSFGFYYCNLCFY